MELVAESREKLGKALQSLRREGLIPAELYGHGIQNKHLSVKAKDFGRVFREAGENTIVNLMISGAKHPVLIHSIQRDHVTNDVAHIDFYQIRMDEKIKVHIPIEFSGDAPAVKEKGGILNKVLSEVEVEVLPEHMPHHFEAQLISLDEIGKSLCVKDLRIGKDIKVLVDPETTVVTVAAPVEEKVEVPVSVEDVKVESEEKKAEREAQKPKEEKA